MSATVTPVIGEATVQELREAVRGEVFAPGDDGYAEAAKIWNGMCAVWSWRFGRAWGN